MKSSEIINYLEDNDLADIEELKKKSNYTILKFYYDFEFISVLHQLKTKNKIEYSDEKIKIFVEYNKHSNSHIKIYNIV